MVKPSKKGRRKLLKATAAYRKFGDSYAVPWIMKCDDNQEYLVKFANEKNDNSIVNELICGKLATKLDLPALEPHLIHIDQELIDNTKDLRDRNIKGGTHLGTQFMSNSFNLGAEIAQKTSINKIQNAEQIPGMIAFDIYVHNIDRHPGNSLIIPVSDTKEKYRYVMIDHGHCFGGPTWNMNLIKNLPISNSSVPWKMGPVNWNSFEPYIKKLKVLTKPDLEAIFGLIPTEWNADDTIKAALLDSLANRNIIGIEQLIKGNMGLSGK